MPLRRKAYLLLKAMRIPEWRGYVGLVAYGALSSLGDTGSILPGALFLAAITFSYMAAIYLVNNASDANLDKLSGKAYRNPAAMGEVGEEELLTAGLLIAACGFAATAAWGRLPLIATYALGVSVGVAYSLPPVRLKGRSPLDLLSHSFFFGTAPYLMGRLTVGEGVDAGILLFISIVSITLELRNELEDFKADLAANCRTTVVVLGCERSRRLLKLLQASVLLLPLCLACLEGAPLSTVLAPLVAACLLVGDDARNRLVDAYASLYLALTLLK